MKWFGFCALVPCLLCSCSVPAQKIECFIVDREEDLEIPILDGQFIVDQIHSVEHAHEISGAFECVSEQLRHTKHTVVCRLSRGE